MPLGSRVYLSEEGIKVYSTTYIHPDSQIPCVSLDEQIRGVLRRNFVSESLMFAVHSYCCVTKVDFPCRDDDVWKTVGPCS